MATFNSTGNDKIQTAADWIPLVEYAHKKDISLSTLRRHIKAGKIPYKVDQGRYLLFDDAPRASSDSVAPSLQMQLQQAREEIAELKTLIAFYEERTHHPRPDV
jgi:hypothetical protein